MDKPGLLERGMLLPGEDFLSLLDTPPHENEQNWLQNPVTPVKQDRIATRPSLAGHTPKTALRTRPTWSPGRLQTSLSVSFLTDPVSETWRYEAGKSMTNTPDLSAFSRIPCFESSENERRDRLADLPPRPIWNIPQIPTPPSDEVSIEKTYSGLSAFPRPPNASATSRRQSMPASSHSTQSLAPQSTPPTRLSRAPLPASPFEPPLTPTARESLDKHAQRMESTLLQPASAPVPEQAPSRRQAFLRRAQNATRTRIFGPSAATRKSNNEKRESGEDRCHAPSEGLPQDLDLQTTFRVVEGCINFDREIKVFFQENAGLRRVWKEEAVPQFKKENKEGFTARVKRLETAMTAMAGKKVVFS